MPAQYLNYIYKKIFFIFFILFFFILSLFINFEEIFFHSFLLLSPECLLILKREIWLRQLLSNMSVMLDLILRAVELLLAQNPTNINIPVGKMGWISDESYYWETINLLYDCLFTLFLCIWSILHLDFPKNNYSQLNRFIRKVKYIVIKILILEFIIYLALF